MKEKIEFNNAAKKKPRVLVAPLDWGLGHATRCISLINELLTVGCEVVIAAEGTQKHLLKQEFPGITCLELMGYRLKYSKKGWQMPFALFFQIPKILISIKRERDWLRGLEKEETFDAVISDNRYGLYSSRIFSVFITHQLSIRTPFGKTIGRIIQKINYHFINCFDACWVPDFEKGASLAGELSHPEKYPRTPVEYIGLLSRFEKKPLIPFSADLLLLLSGPEPQRSIFENLLLEQLKTFSGKAILIRGLPGEKNIISAPANLKIYNHLPADTLNNLICSSEYIISRSGYSTVMDLVKLDRKSILVPTPGQTEQEYLAGYLSGKKIACFASQHHFSLQDSLENARQFPFHTFTNGEPLLLQSAINSLLKKIK